MKKIVTLLFILLNAVFVQGQTWQWAKSAGLDAAESNGMTSDSSGNIYVTGYFTGPSITFDSITLPNKAKNPIYASFFIVKYNPSGKVVWAIGGGDSLGASTNGITSDALANIYVVGSFNGSLTFGASVLMNSDTLRSPDAFVAKFDSSGNFQWAKGAGIAAHDEIAFSAAVDHSGDVYIAGVFSGDSIRFGSTLLINDTVPSHSLKDIFFVKYSNAGSLIWAKRAGGKSFEIPFALSADPFGNICMAGNFSSPSISFGTTTLINSSSNKSDIFLVKYDGNGNPIWARREGNTDNETAYSMCMDANGNIYVAGGFNSATFKIGSTTLTNTSTSVSYADVFLAKYDSAGNPIWAKSAQGNYDDYARTTAVDASGNVYLGGYFGSTSFTYGSATFTNHSPGPTIFSDLFAIKCDSAGKVLWSKTASGKNTELLMCLQPGASGSVYAAGSFISDTVLCDADTLLHYKAVTGQYNAFVGKISTLVSVEEVLNKSTELMIFPNPLVTYSSLHFDTRLKDAEVVIYDMLGKEIMRKTFSGNEVQIEKGKMESGLYFVKMRAAEKEWVEKLMVE